ncbi:MAG TPA: hypothetical protein VGN88_08510 [Phycisphaerae bacterium]|jgi:hypothetical protein
MKSQKRIFLALAMLWLGGTFAFAAPGVTTSPAATRTSATAAATSVAPDYSTPRDAMKTFLRASFYGDIAAMRGALDIPPAHTADVDAYLGTMESSARLQDAAAAIFKSAGVKQFGSSPDLLSDRLKTVDAIEPAMKGDVATMDLPESQGQAGRTVTFKKSGSDWKIDAVGMFDLELPAAKIAERVDLAKKIKAVTDEMAKEVKDKKFPSATDAYQEYWSRCRLVTVPGAAPLTAGGSTVAVPTGSAASKAGATRPGIGPASTSASSAPATMPH